MPGHATRMLASAGVRAMERPRWRAACGDAPCAEAEQVGARARARAGLLALRLVHVRLQHGAQRRAHRAQRHQQRQRHHDALRGGAAR
eukprot:6189078-Pleurochrysis_carterae.AAC.2